MEPPSGQDYDFNDVVETLTSMFGEVISRDVIAVVVESAQGDLNYAAEAIINMSADTVEEPPEISETMGDTTPGTSEQQRSQASLQTNIPSNIIDNSQVSSSNIQQNIPVATTSQLVPFTQVTEPTGLKEFSPISQTVLKPAVFAQSTMSYAGASRSTGAVPKQFPRPQSPLTKSMIWTDQLRQIMIYHTQGSRILLLMRGAPGSGKSYLAMKIIDMTIGATYADYRNHIFSTDDFFMVHGHYRYEKSKLSVAHDWNHNRVRFALRQGLSPVVVDNTHIEPWEMEFYVREGVSNGYFIEVIEPNTPWAKSAGQLMRRNSHNVPLHTIRRMLENYQDGITGDYLIRYYSLSYPGHMVPPVVRTLPKYNPPIPGPSKPQYLNTTPVVCMQRDLVHTPYPQPQQVNQNRQTEKESQSFELQQEQLDIHNVLENMKIDLGNTTDTTEIQQQTCKEFNTQSEEFEKVEQEWENGERWLEEAGATASCSRETSAPLDPKPQRRTNSESSASTPSTPREKLIETVQKCDDWRKIALFMPSWADENTQVKENSPHEFPDRDVVQTSSSYTCMEIGDTDLDNTRKILKIMPATPRDINLYHIPQPEKIPEKRMLDKSTTTNEMLITESLRCENEEQHFVAFRKLFKNVPRAALRDIFDKCCGDVNWAVDIALGCISENLLQTCEGAEMSDTEEDIQKQGQCNCLAAYQVGIDQSESQITTKAQVHAGDTIKTISASELLPLKKVKIVPSNSSLLLKSAIEKNIIIPDEHYSSHVVKLKNRRHRLSSNESGDTTALTPVAEGPSMESPLSAVGEQIDASKQTKNEACFRSDDEESNTSSLDDAERTVTMYVGHEFIKQLDNLFGRRGIVYPDTAEPRISIPVSLLNEINAFWIESLMCQLDEQDKQNYKMVKEDEDFAKQLAVKEAELAEQGIEPEVPDFKEIMDMDFALSVYQKDVAGWKNKEPTDIAAKMTRDKLYNMFPDMSQEILSEMLMAHDNNFRSTVEVLLMSTGRADVLQDKNGINKFVMQNEIAQQEKLLREEKSKAILSSAEWPMLPQGQKVEMAMVNSFREEANRHLVRRNLHYQKAQEFFRRGMTTAAVYYNGVAAFHKTRYEQINSLAAISLIQVHAANSTDNQTIDLHYLRVAEAKQALDIFIDTHIQSLKENTSRGARFVTLFFITGRGLHSNGGPKLKPAVKKRLQERGLVSIERNPGLLSSRVCAEDKLTYQLQ